MRRMGEKWDGNFLAKRTTDKNKFARETTKKEQNNYYKNETEPKRTKNNPQELTRPKITKKDQTETKRIEKWI